MTEVLLYLIIPASTPISSPSHGLILPHSQSTLASPGDALGGNPSSSLIEYTRFLQQQNWRLKSQRFLENMKKLKPLDVRYELIKINFLQIKEMCATQCVFNY